MMRLHATWLAIGASAALWCATAAGAAGRYDGDRVVRVQLESQRQVDLMRSISPDCWCEAIGVGTLDFRVPAEAMPALDASGIAYRVLIENVQDLVDDERARLDAAAPPDGAAAAGAWYLDFKNLAAIEARLNAFVALHPNIAQLVDVGDSLEGRTIHALRVSGSGDPKPGVLFNACQHAREWISPMVAMYIADTLVSGYGNDPQITSLVDDLEFFIIPVVNPDGYEYSWGPDRFWRKNRRDNGGGIFGVDLNRNWSVGWGEPGADSFPDGETYRGPNAFSEPETQVVRDFYLAHQNIVASIDFHSYGQLVLRPWSYQTGEPDGGLHMLIGDAMAAAILGVHGMGYTSQTGIDLYPASGTVIDWTWGDQDVISYTIELRSLTGSPGFLLPPEEIIPTCEENLAAMLTLSEAAAAGVIYDFPGGLPELLDAAGPTTVAVAVTPVTSGALDPASARVFWRSGGGAFAEDAMVSLGGDTYEATIPAQPCGDPVEYYFEIHAALSGAPYRSPSGAPEAVYDAESVLITTGFEDDFEADAGWTVSNVDLTGGAWERGVPAGDGDRGDPLTDFDGSGACYLTGNAAGNSDVDGGPTQLLSPLIDLSGLDDPQLSYGRWFTNDDGDGDSLDVEISNDDGGAWVLVESTGATGGWNPHTVRVADFVAPTSTMRLRFSATDNPNDSVTEAAVDAVHFYDAGCPAGPAGDIDGDGDVDFGDLLALLGAWGPCAACPEDLDGDGSVSFADLLILLGNWG